MFHFEEDNKKVGAYLKELIEKKFSSVRQFCKKIIKIKYNSEDKEDVRKMHNRFSQILKGKKTLQTHDLPAVTELLGVSCEEILSAGQNLMPTNNHVTNYSVAFSKDEKVWQDYIDRDDKLILNYDEYGKSVLDYAYEFRNYSFLKYLTDRGYIKFEDSSDCGFMYNYGAETTIKRRTFQYTDLVESNIKYSDDLRMDIITLAIENKDYDMLKKMHARETPMLHFAAMYSNQPQEPQYYDISRLIKGIINAPNDIIKYFTEDYTISDKSIKQKGVFIFQHIDKVIDGLITKNDKRVLDVITAATEHNNKVHSEVEKVIDEAVKMIMDNQQLSKSEALEMTRYYSWIYDDCGALRFFCMPGNRRIITNIIRCSATTCDPEIKEALERLNSSYEQVKSIVDRRH